MYFSRPDAQAAAGLRCGSLAHCRTGRGNSAGEVDLALGFSTPEDNRHPELEEIGWFEDEYVVISNARRTRLTLEDYLAARHRW